MKNDMLLAKFGKWEARYDFADRRYYVIDTVTRAQFNQSSKAGAIYRAKRNWVRDAHPSFRSTK